MDKVKVFFDREANTLTVWLSDLQQEYISEETGDEVVLIKDISGRVIGFEKLNFSRLPAKPFDVAFETVS